MTRRWACPGCGLDLSSDGACCARCGRRLKFEPAEVPVECVGGGRHMCPDCVEEVEEWESWEPALDDWP